MLPSRRKIQFACLFLVLGLLSASRQSASGQTALAASDPPPLIIDNNFFVNGDYVIAGANGMTSQFENRGNTTYAVGTITIPDTNPGIKPSIITGTNQVPAGAQIVAALLYWQTVEKIGVTPGQSGSGQNGFFRPKFNGGPPIPGYPISGVALTSPGASTVSWSSGGCTSGSTGKVIRTYRSSVLGALPVDSKGNIIVNGQDSGVSYGTYELRLPSSTSTTPITLGATLVIIYRVLPNPNFPVPLNAIVIYDGDFAPSNTSLTMTQQLQGFYQADKNPISRLTHIVGNGKSKKSETVSLNGQALPSFYPNGQPSFAPYTNAQPPFPGYYGSWDNPTWTFTDPNSNPVKENDASATTRVVPADMQQGCVSWGAIILSTTVKNSAGDGILDVWKTNRGYTDVGTGQFVSLADPADQPQIGQKDVYIQLDHIVDQQSGVSYAPDPQAWGMVQNAFLANNHNVHLHITDASKTTLINNADAIPQQKCVDSPNSNPPSFCSYPNQLVTTWRAGFEFLKNRPLNYPDETSCETRTLPNGTPGTGPACIRQFPPAQKDSYYYVLFGNALGQAKWTLGDGTLAPVTVSNGTVTFTTSTPHGLAGQGNLDPMDTYCGPNGRVTIVDAITASNLNGIFCIFDFPDDFHFRVQNAKATATNLTRFTDPNLAVFAGHADRRSGSGDQGGAGAMVTLGTWKLDQLDPQQKINTQAGTLAHEIGHLFGLPHGGEYFDDNKNPYVPTFEPNCKANYQSVMSYRFQVDLLDKLIGGQLVGGFLDFSGEELGTLNAQGQFIALSENNLSGVTALKTSAGGDPAYWTTRWYSPPTPSQITNLTLKKGNAKLYCDGTPLPTNNPPFMYLHEGPAKAISWSDPLNGLLQFFWQNGQDIDFDATGSPSGKLRGFNDWKNLDLRLRGASASAYVIGVGGGLPSGGGGLPSGGGGLPSGGGGLPSGGGGLPSGGGGLPSGGGGLPSGGGGLPSGGGTAGDITFETAASVPRSPRNVTASEGVSPRTITVSWMGPTFGQVVRYNIYRSADNGATFGFLASVPVGTLTYPDVVTCNPTGYRYYVTAVTLDGTGQEQESGPSNIAPASTPPLLTGCYTNTPPAVNLSDLSFPNTNFVKGDLVNSINWSLQDDDNGVFVSNQNSLPTLNTLRAIGPIPYDGVCSTLQKPPAFLGYTGPPPYPYTVTTLSTSGNGLTFVANRFSYIWNTANFNAGCYFFELDLDSGQAEISASALTLLIKVTPASLPDAVAGTAYTNGVFTQSGGVMPFTWTVDSGVESLPPGLLLDQSSGTLTGTPTTAGTYHFTVKVTDTNQNYGTQVVTLKVNLGITPTSLPDGVTGTAYNNTLTANGGTGTVTWSTTSGALPPGITFGGDGTLSGTPTAPGTFHFTVQAQDGGGNTGTQALTIRVFGCATTTTGLVSWYPFNGNALDIRGGKPGTVVGSGSQFVTGEVGQGFQPGVTVNNNAQTTTGLVVVPDSPTLALTQLTIGAWVQVNSIDNVQTMQIVWKGDSTASDVSTPYALMVQGSAGLTFTHPHTVIGTPGPGKLIVFITNGTSELDVFSSTALTAGTFHHIAVTADTQTVNLYIDGQLDTSTPQLYQTFANTNPLQIGGIQGNGVNPNSDGFDGVIDELQIYNRALSAAEISAIASAAASGQCSTMWYSQEFANTIGRINLNGLGVSGFPVALPTANANPYGITVGPDGNVWVAEYGTGKIAVTSPTGAVVAEYQTPLPSPNPTGLTKTGPTNITAGPDGNLWFTEWDVNQVASITNAGTVNAYPLTGTNPWGITAGPDGNIWFTELNGNAIGKITPSGILTEYAVPTNTSNPAGITTGPDGNIWFTEWLADKIGVLSPTSGTVIAEYALPPNALPPGPPGTSNSGPQSITLGPDGNLWFTETNNDKIGKITPDGTTITEYSVPSGTYPFAITAGLDGNLWFTAFHSNKIGLITPNGTSITLFTVSDNTTVVTTGP